jgi:hypothetical protein
MRMCPAHSGVHGRESGKEIPLPVVIGVPAKLAGEGSRAANFDRKIKYSGEMAFYPFKKSSYSHVKPK